MTIPEHPLGQNPSFFDLVRGLSIEPSPPAAPPEGGPLAVTRGTTVLALRFADGVIMAGDRRAVEGYAIADAKTQKVFPTDDHSAVGIAGVAGQAIEMVRLFQTELEHYEKVEGDRLSLEGKANRLAQMIRSALPLAFQGLIVVPVFAGFDLRLERGRIFRYDVVGGRYEESDYHATGSGGRAAEGSMKKRWREGLGRQDATEVAVEALVDAGEEDTATAGPDPIRGIYPNVFVITADGVQEIPDAEVKAAFEAIVERRGTA